MYIYQGRTRSHTQQKPGLSFLGATKYFDHRIVSHTIIVGDVPADVRVVCKLSYTFRL